MHLECLDPRTGLTSGAADIGSEVLRSVAQVILKRAERAGWGMLRDVIREGARCDEAPSKASRDVELAFPKTCRTLGTLEIRDLVSSPAALIDALIADVLAIVAASNRRPFVVPALLDQALVESAARWEQGDVQGLVSGLRHVLGRAVKENLAKPTCDRAKAAPDKAFWAIGMCLIEVQNPQSYEVCDVSGWAEMCAPPPSEIDGAPSSRGAGERAPAIAAGLIASPPREPPRTAGGPDAELVRANIFRLWSLGARALAVKQPSLADLVKMTFAVADLYAGEAGEEQARESREYIDALRAFFLGIANKDWIAATTGAVRVMRFLGRSRAACAGGGASDACEAARAEDSRTERLFTVMAAVGSYAETFSRGSGDPASASAAREKIIEDLVDRMVNRTDRTSGAVISLGGNVGLFGGARTDLTTGAEVGFPLQLGVGVGLQTYQTGRGGFHAELSVFDLGHYVSLGGGDLKVESPSFTSAISLGLTLGGWVGLRETPLYVGVHGGMSPFVRADSKITYTFGAVTGIYVPLFDFN